jgi:hypothetical protein
MIVRFPDRRRVAILVLESVDGWLTLAPSGHGWLHSEREDALRDARWLAANYGLPIRRPT